MTEYVLPILFSLFVWWFSTGAIIFLDGLPQKTFRWSLAGATIVFAGSLWGLAATAHETTLTAAYLAFTFGLLAWGWQEISFYMGYVTGPRRAPCPEDCRGFRHFLHAVQTSLWHELAIIAAAVVVWALTRGEPNQIGFWTFIVLWWMHQSAKLNVFFGVRNLNEEFLPEHLTFLKSFLRRRPMNLLFPVSITVSTVIAAILFERAGTADTAFARVGDTMLGTLMALAILEHWFLVLPLPAGKLWQWGLASRKPTQNFDIEIVAGFLGAGKTTFMRRRLAMLAEAPEDRRGRTIALVNDFSSVGIDGSLLAGQGADVVELPNGCICCSLRNDLARQLEDVVARYAPDRVLIEPSGVADLASLVGVLERPEIAKLRRSLTIVTMIDAGAFLADFAAMQTHFEAQARLASLLVLNKTDLVGDAERATVRETLRRLNPDVHIVEAVYGAVPDTALAAAFTGEFTAAPADDAHDHHGHAHGDDDHAHAAHQHDHDHDHGAEALGFGSWNTALAPHCDAEALAKVLDATVAGHFGQIVRLKGLARAGKGWIQFDVAGGKKSMTAFAANGEETARVVAIGNALDVAGLDAAFAGCALDLAA